jgi:hypothetical protein
VTMATWFFNFMERSPAERVIKDIKRQTRRAAEEKIRIVLGYLRDDCRCEHSLSCQRVAISPHRQSVAQRMTQKRRVVYGCEVRKRIALTAQARPRLGSCRP